MLRYVSPSFIAFFATHADHSFQTTEVSTTTPVSAGFPISEETKDEKPLGMHGDLNATYPVGKVDEASLDLIKTTKQSLDEAIAICKPGALYRHV
jgi:methionine aminopeptidase